MSSSAQRPSRFFCHPDFIVPALGSHRQYPLAIAACDLVAFSEALQTDRVVCGTPSQYRILFEDADVFIRVVSSRPLQVRTFIAQKNMHYPSFFEYPSQVPSPTYFTRRSVLLDQRVFSCNHCGKTYACYFYYRKITGTVDGRPRGSQSLQSGASKKEDTPDGSNISPGAGRRGSRRRALRELARRASKYISRGAKWVGIKLRGEPPMQTTMGWPVGTDSD